MRSFVKVYEVGVDLRKGETVEGGPLVPGCIVKRDRLRVPFSIAGSAARDAVGSVCVTDILATAERAFVNVGKVFHRVRWCGGLVVQNCAGGGAE